MRIGVIEELYRKKSTMRLFIRLAILLPFLIPGFASAQVDPYVSGRAIVSDIGRVITPHGVQETFEAILKLEIPVFMFLCRHDCMTPSAVADDWMRALIAPKKKTVWFESSAHLPMIDEPGRVFMSPVNDVQPLTLENQRRSAE
jgi:pimeloyl-ACP methyl ester carboxylesterase